MESTHDKLISRWSREQLVSAIDAYPWFSVARAALCRWAMKHSGPDVAKGLFRDSLVWLPDEKYLADCFLAAQEKNFEDDSLADDIRRAIEEKARVIVTGSDFFSKDDYDNVREANDDSLRKMGVVDYSVPFNPENMQKPDNTFDMVTETLAQIYVDQGYPEHAKDIYMKLSLLNPEKSAYFAGLIEKL